MGDAESALPSSKKRVAGRQLSKDNPDPDDDASELEMGTFQRASDEVMTTKKIVKVRPPQPASSISSNPFAGICLVRPTDSSAKIASPTDLPQTGTDTTASEEQNNNNENIGKSGEDKELESGTVVNETEGVWKRGWMRARRGWQEGGWRWMEEEAMEPLWQMRWGRGQGTAGRGGMWDGVWG